MSRARYIGAAAGVAVAATIALRYANPIKTPGVTQIENRYSSGGGSSTHTPGVATKRGDEGATLSPHLKKGGVSTQEFKETISDQKPEKNTATQKFYEAHYGNPRGP